MLGCLCCPIITPSDESSQVMQKTAYLIDGMAYVFRSFFAIRSMAAPDGTPINAVFGLGMTLQRLLHDQKPDLVACCFDSGAKTFRNEMYPDYKANRAAPPEELIPQFDLCQELVSRMGIPLVVAPGYEADDLIATLTGRLLADGYSVAIVTGDKDLAQLIEPRVKVYDLARNDWWDEARIPKKMGVKAAQVTDFLALTGDSAVNIPGVRGIGPKAATALLNEFPDLDTIFQNLDRVEMLPVRGAKGLRQKLETGRENALLSRRLVELDSEVPCKLNSGDMHYLGAESEALEEFAATWGLGRVADRVPRR